MAYGDFRDLTRRTAADIFLLDKAFNIASIVYIFFDKKLQALVLNVCHKMSN